MNCLKLLHQLKSTKPLAAIYCHPLVAQSSTRWQSTQTRRKEPDIADTGSGDRLSSLDLSSRDVDRDYRIYRAPENMVKLIKTIKMFSISTTVLAMGCQPFIIQQIMSTNPSTIAIGFVAVTFGGTALSPLLLNWFTRRYATQLYYNRHKKLFTAWSLNLLCRPRSFQYSAAEVSVPEALGMFTTYTVMSGGRKRPLFVDPAFVTDLEAYKVMLGYDKPLDLKLDNILDKSAVNEHKSINEK